MGRAANRKWRKRQRKYRKATVAERLRLIELFGQHPKFWRG